MRKPLSWLVLLACLAPAARAQDVEVFGGYSYLRSTETNYAHHTLNGWNAALSANIKSWDMVADFSNHYAPSTDNFSPIGNGETGAMYLFGPQYSFRHVPHVTPFVHALFGGVQAQRIGAGIIGPLGVCPAPGCNGYVITPETVFAMALGGGLDFKVRDHVWIRAFQVDYVHQEFSNGSTNSPRISAGIVFRFGRK
jgi:hypothetical protein